MVEDDLAILGVNTAILIFYGYAMAAGEGGMAAWDALKLERYDLMVTDHEMPKASGVELLKKVHAIRPLQQ